MSVRLHIGFDFWGAGNMGDDLMLKGFLSWFRTHDPAVEISALCGYDIAAMRRRFPTIRWYPSDPESQADALSQADAWIGLGGGVFQIEVGTWILDQMAQSLTAAKARGLPCFLVGVGVNNREALATPQAHTVHDLADRIWMRDSTCLEMAIEAGFSPEKVLLGADSGHLAFTEPATSSRNRSAAFVLHADEGSLSPQAVSATVDRIPAEWVWLCQESRPLADSEVRLHLLLPEELRQRVPLLALDYATTSLDRIQAHVSSWALVLSSRYHTTLASAWGGSRVAVFERNQKLRAIRHELGLEACGALNSADEMVRALEAARPARPETLRQCRARAHNMLASLRELVRRR